MNTSPLRIAWFRPAAASPTPALDDIAALVPELAPEYQVDLFTERAAHQFVWRHARDPYDLCIHELADTPSHAFIWPYVFHYPGILRLRSPSLGEGRAFALGRTLRHADYRREAEFGGWDMLRAPVLASRLVVVSDDLLAAQLQRDHPSATVRAVPIGIGRPQDGAPRPCDIKRVRVATSPGARALVARAVARARAAGAPMGMVPALTFDDAVQEADVLFTLDWPPSTGDPPIAALIGMSLGKAVVVLETVGTARWPALDPQTWHSRALAGRDAPLVISIDPRDEEHSLGLVMRRLAAEPALIDRLAAAGHAWWQEHATLAHAAAGWRTALADARSLTPPPAPDDRPSHLLADGTQHARRLLADLLVDVDFLRPDRR